MVGFVRRFDPSYRNAAAAVEAGEIGRPFLVRSQTCDKNDPDGFFVRLAPTSGGIFMDCSVHDIDLARWLLGEHAARDWVIRSDAAGVGHAVLGDFYERFESAFAHEMSAFVAACRGVEPLTLTLSDAMEATRIGLAITRSLRSGMPEAV